ncbi:lamin tail domain-containing protein [bacterium]|nr:lamin tail domain-containing protein [bacterium]
MVAMAQPGSVLINEIMYDDTATTDIEWVELFNTTPFPIPIGNWVLTDGNVWPPPSTEGAIQIPPGTIISAHGYLVISKTATPGIPSIICAEIDAAWTLNNNGDNLALYDGNLPASLLIDGSLTDNFPDLSGANLGNSLEKCDQFQPWTSNPSAWHESTFPFSPTGRFRFCTPGMPNSPCAALGRCCYGELGIDCADITEFNCTQLGGAWSATLNCAANPCIPCVCPNQETEPNNAHFSANPLPLVGNVACIRGTIEDPNELDVFSFHLAFPSRITAVVRSNDDPGTCAYQGGLNSAVGLQVVRNSQAFFLQAASSGHIGDDPRLFSSIVLDPGEYFIAVGSDSGSSTVGPWVLDLEVYQLIEHPPIGFGFGNLTIQSRKAAQSPPPAEPDSLIFRWDPGPLAESYTLEHTPDLNGVWQSIAFTTSNSVTLPFDTTGDVGFFRVIANAPLNRHNHIQDYVGSLLYPPDDTLGQYPIRVDSIMMTASPDSFLQIAYFVGEFTGAIAPDFSSVTVRWDDRLDLFADGSRNVLSLDGMKMNIGGVPHIIDFARVSTLGTYASLAPLIAHQPLNPSYCVLAGVAGGSGCKDRKGWRCEPKNKDYGNGRVPDCPPPSPPFDPSPECAASACVQSGENCVCQGAGGVGCDLPNSERCFKAPFHNLCTLHTTCPAESVCQEYLVLGDVSRFFRYLFVDHCECVE